MSSTNNSADGVKGGWIDIQVVDAFTPTSFGGNPAGVVFLDPQNGVDLTENQKQIIAQQMNLSETAFLTPAANGSRHTYRLQWFTPASEEKLCGHATVGSTAALSFLSSNKDIEKYQFDTLSGRLTGRVIESDEETARIELDFPDDVPNEVTADALQEKYKDMFGRAVRNVDEKDRPELLEIWKGKFDVVYVVKMKDGSRHLGDLDIDFGSFSGSGARGCVLTTALSGATSATPSSEPQFHSRFFAPDLSVPEDPVTGSLHCLLAVLWTQKLGKSPGDELFASQGGTRQGQISVVWDQSRGRVLLRGRASKTLTGRIRIPPA